MINKRETGFYWVYTRDKVWTIEYWYDERKEWYGICKIDGVPDEYFLMIDERKIDRETRNCIGGT